MKALYAQWEDQIHAVFAVEHGEGKKYRNFIAQCDALCKILFAVSAQERRKLFVSLLEWGGLREPGSAALKSAPEGTALQSHFIDAAQRAHGRTVDEAIAAALSQNLTPKALAGRLMGTLERLPAGVPRVVAMVRILGEVGVPYAQVPRASLTSVPFFDAATVKTMAQRTAFHRALAIIATAARMDISPIQFDGVFVDAMASKDLTRTERVVLASWYSKKRVENERKVDALGVLARALLEGGLEVIEGHAIPVKGRPPLGLLHRLGLLPQERLEKVRAHARTCTNADCSIRAALQEDGLFVSGDAPQA